MEKKNFKKNIQDSKVKITDQGDIIKVAEKTHPSRIKNGLHQADRGDSKKPVVKTIAKVTNVKNETDKTRETLSSVKEIENIKTKSNNVRHKTDNTKDKEYLDVDSTIELQIKQALEVKENSDKKCIKSNEDQNKLNVKVLDANERKRIREKYTIKSKISTNQNGITNVSRDYTQKNIAEAKERLDTKSISTNTKDSRSNKISELSRKPVITTIRSKNDTRVYKSVTFTEQKHNVPTPIEIKIPTDIKRKEKDKILDRNTEISSPIKDRVKRNSKRKKRRPLLSPELLKKRESPPTEVAKWAPSSVNKHTLQYYEAWVDTTLAAISKCSKNDKMNLEKRNLLKSFKRFLEKPKSPELVYDQMDERYTGRIKVRQRK